MRLRAIDAAVGGVAALALILAACGGDDSSDTDAGAESGALTEDGSAGGSAGSGAGDAGVNEFGYRIIPCPDDLEFSIGMEAVGDEGVVTARLHDAVPAPPERYRNDWVLDLLDADGEPLTGAEITMARAWMPAHLHDGTFPPVVRELAEPGRVAVDNLNMWMGGPWEVQLTITSGGDEDYLVFDVCIPE